MTKKKNASSYIDELSSGHESDTVKEYSPGTDGQIGKAHEEEVAKSNNWDGDNRDPIGRAAKRNVARKLRRIAREIEAMDAEIDQEYAEDIEDAAEQAEDQAKGTDAEGKKANQPEDVSNKSIEELMEEIESEEEEEQEDEYDALDKEAAHPIDHNPAGDDPQANMSSQTGDEEWIDIGPGEFSDPRDTVGKAA